MTMDGTDHSPGAATETPQPAECVEVIERAVREAALTACWEQWRSLGALAGPHGPHRAASIVDPEALVVWVESVEDRDALLAADPATFFTTPHYDGTPIVLVRLDVVDEEEAAELVTESWRLRAPSSLVREWEAQQG